MKTMKTERNFLLGLSVGAPALIVLLLFAPHSPMTSLAQSNFPPKKPTPKPRPTHSSSKPVPTPTPRPTPTPVRRGPIPLTPAKFAGAWELDKEKSQLPQVAVNRLIVEIWTITQDDKQILRERKYDMGRGFVTADVIVKLDGGETTAEPNPRVKSTTKAKWLNNGRTLEITTLYTSSGPDGDYTSTTVEQWELADGGKTLKVYRKQKSPRSGILESNLVFTKPRPIPLISMSFTTARLDAYGNVTKIPGGVVSGLVEDLGNGVKLEVIKIPGGEFDMGSPSYEEGRDSDKEVLQPGVRVNGFYLGRFEVTQEQWEAVMGTLPSGMSDLDGEFKSSKQPVVHISWDEAKEFCQRLSRRTGRGYRLPTEAEWEYAARAGTRTPFAFGETITTEIVNYQGNYPYGNAPKGAIRGRTIAVGSLGMANAFGLFDMYGNVMEWCEDWYGTYDPTQLDNPKGPSSGSSHVLRGGSWNDGGSLCRSAKRGGYKPSIRGSDIGFRVVCVSAWTK